MKKLVLSMAAIALFAMTANAQIWIGGSVGYSSESEKETWKNAENKLKESKPASTTISISPKVGYQLNDKLEVGGLVSLSSSKTYDDKLDDKDVWIKKVSYSIAPFARYQFASFGKFALKAVGSISFGQVLPSTKDGKEKTAGDKTTTLALNAYPIISYTLSDKFDFEAGLNFFGLSASTSTTKDADDSDIKLVENSFNLFGNANTVATTGFITVGFIYRL